MAVITARPLPNGPSIATPLINASNQVGAGLICGEDLLPGDACFIKASDGKVYKSGGSGVTAITDEGAKIHGYAATRCLVAQSDAVTLLTDVDIAYGAEGAFTPGMPLWLDCTAATKGRIGTVRPIAGLPPCGFATNSQTARLFICMGVPLT